ncbi:TOMM precursor leader peptide-binding protein [Streptomyces rimosus]|uniref:TOMM precursor leader peptide-binding protein n=1 Tax=Streptomyces rimosus TaxID=1927 RepID=UPI0004C74849|nr:TOMM precursor leader peptide-binding protein [Streptomyces rimosus]
MVATTGDGSTGLLGFRPHLCVEQVPGEAVYVLSDQRATALHGEQIACLAPLLDGTRSLDQVVEDAAAALPAEQTARLIARLSDAGLVSTRPDGAAAGGTAAEAAYWEAAGLDGAAATVARAAATVHAAAVGGTDLAALRRALRGTGLRTVPAGRADTADLTVVLCDDYLNPALRTVDAEHRAAGRPWLPVMTDGTRLWIGPFFGRSGQACWACLADRLWRGRQVEAHVQHSLRRTGPVPRPQCALPATRQAGMHLAASEAAKWLAGRRHPDQHTLWTLDTLTLEGGRHPVHRRPQCDHCGDSGLVAARVNAPLRLTSRLKRDTAGGGHRALTPQQLLDTYGHLLDPVTGLVKEIRQDSRGPAFLNSFHAGLNPVSDPRGIGAVRACLRSTSGGKGTTALQARTGALAEALERHSGYFQGDEPTVRGTYRSLAADAVHPDAVQLYDRRQFEQREGWNAEHGPAQQVCDPFDDDAEIDWTPVWSLTEQRHKLLPTAFLYYNVPQPRGRAYCMGTSNGAAAGGSLEDAVLQGFLELVERDAVALWWYNRSRLPGVDLTAFGDAWTGELREVHASLHREVWALDLTTDFGIPVFAAASRRTDKPEQDIVFGFGAHFDPRTALRRALTELNQLLPNVVSAAADGSGYGISDPGALRWMRTATVDNQPYVVPDPGRAATRPQDHPYTPRADLYDDLAAVEELVRGRGLELLVLDQTRPDVGLPVVKVIVPGLRPHWPRFAPGRLFDVPVALGRTDRPTPYDELNPIPLFL